jgi:glutathione S-transferase
MAQKQPDITVYYLQSTRSIRPVWLLEELGVPYKLEVAPYKQEPAERQAFNELSASPMGKYPSIRDGELIMHESGAILEYSTSPRRHVSCTLTRRRYLCEHYDPQHRLIPQDPAQRARAQIFLHAAEGTLAMHAIANFYFRIFMPQQFRESAADVVAAAEAKMATTVAKDMDWLERELAQSTGPFLVGDTLTVADIMVLFVIQLTYKFKFGGEGKSWPKIEAWVKTCEESASYKRAVERSGFTL